MKIATLVGSFFFEIMKNDFDNIDYKEFYFIDSLKDKNTNKNIEKFLESLSEKEIENLKELSMNHDLLEDLQTFCHFFKNNFQSEDLFDFLINYENRLDESSSKIPKFKDEKAMFSLFQFVSKIWKKNKFPRQKIISKSKTVGHFKVDSVTFNEWLKYFGKEEYLGRKEFTSKEWSEIINDLANVEGLKMKKIEKYRFQCYNKLEIAKIIFGVKLNKKTLYRKLQNKHLEIDDLNPQNKNFLAWIENHDKIPFSLAHQWISLLLLWQEEKEQSILQVFEKYYENS